MGSWTRKVVLYVWCFTHLPSLTVGESTLPGFTWPEAPTSTASSTLSSSIVTTVLSTTSLFSDSAVMPMPSPTLSFNASPDVSSSPSTVYPAAIQTSTIKVGEEDHKFTPEVIYANVGDVVRFQFYPLNHSVVRAEYKHSCEPYEKYAGRGHGFFSDFHATKIGDKPSVWDLTIDHTDPMFFYCSAPTSCDQLQMVGVINPTSDVSLAVQKEFSRNATVQQPDAASNVAASYTPPSHPPLSTGAIVGISLTGLLILVLAAALFFFIGRSRSLKQEVKRRNSTISPLPSSAMYPHPSFLSPHAEAMMSPSSRNSAVVFGPCDYGRDAAPEYSSQGGAHLRSETASPGPDWARGRTPNLAPDTPIRRVSMLSSVQSPQEMDASDGKQPKD